MRRDLSIVAIIALYNGAPYIEGSIRSVLAQTLAPDEFIVVDDGSTDDGPGIVERLSRDHPQIRLLTKANGGQSSARNFGVSQSRSALIALLDQDDAWYPEHLAELVAVFRTDEGEGALGWAYSDLDRVDEEGNLLVRDLLRHAPGVHPKRRLADCLAHDMHILPSASLIARDAFADVGGFDEALLGYEDDDLFLRLFLRGHRNVFVPCNLSLWRYNTRSASFSPRMAQSRRLYTDRLMERFADDPASGVFHVRDRIAPRFARISLICYILALQTDDRPAMQAARTEIARLIPRLNSGPRLSYGLFLAVTTATPVAKLGWATWQRLRPLMGRSREG